MKYLITILCIVITNCVWCSNPKDIAESIVSIAARDGLGEEETELLVKLAETLYDISGLKDHQNELRTKLEKYAKGFEKRKIEGILDVPIKGIHRDKALLLLSECAARLKGTVIVDYSDSELIVLVLKHNKVIELEATMIVRDDCCVGFDHGFNYIIGLEGQAEQVAGGDATR